VALDEVVNKASSYVSGFMGKEGPIQESGRMMLGGLVGAAAPIVLGACGALRPQIAMNPLTWFYTGGLGLTATGAYQLDSVAGKVLMTIPALGYFLPKTLEALSYGMASTVPYVSSIFGTIGTGISTGVGYVTSGLSSASMGTALPYIGVAVAVVGLLYAGYRIAKGWLNKAKGKRTYNGTKKGASKS